jgi:predicted adenylyl cyclase CyaB
MPTEFERAYITRDVDAVRANLARFNLLLVKKESQLNMYYDHPFLELIESKKYLRVRWIDGWNEAEISFSAPVVDGSGIEKRPQFSFKKNGKRAIDKVIELLESVGFRGSLLLEKERELYALGGILDAGATHVEIDTGITIHPKDIKMLPRAKSFDVRLEDTVQVCVEMEDPGKKSMEMMVADINRFSREIGLLETDVTVKNYFDRYFDHDASYPGVMAFKR